MDFPLFVIIENLNDVSYGIEADIIESFENCEQKGLANSILNLIKQYDTIEEVEMAMGVLHSLVQKNNDVKIESEHASNCGTLTKLHLRRVFNLTQISTDVAEFSLYKSNLSNIINGINTMLNLNQNLDQDQP